ncbi:MAG: hypothetical protein K6F90_03180 [Lachnospiraceae bacterium]|nr:hypothetical protein [Lachnospiraceae bacterium]
MTHLDFTFETREEMIRRDAREEAREELLGELQPQIDALVEEKRRKDTIIEELRAQLANVK